MSLAEKLIDSDELDASLRETRHLIHVNPELMLEEHLTSGLVLLRPTELGVSFRAGVGADGRSLCLSKEVMQKSGIRFGATTGGTDVLGEIRGAHGIAPGR